jgi:hypothetical protein|tara:strand:- start:623 stop:811 length:189 start_codon:yes stop_codon:yes gene_type:complete
MQTLKNYIQVIIGIEIILILAMLGVLFLQEMQLMEMEMGSWALGIEEQYGKDVWDRLKDMDD